jgi:DNA-binding transcriptional LysR family regulator
VAGEVSFQSTALWMVSSGMGVAIMPTAYVRQSAYQSLVIQVLQEPQVPRDVYIVTKRGRHLSPACEAFLQVLRTSCNA